MNKSVENYCLKMTPNLKINRDVTKRRSVCSNTEVEWITNSLRNTFTYIYIYLYLYVHTHTHTHTQVLLHQWELQAQQLEEQRAQYKMRTRNVLQFREQSPDSESSPTLLYSTTFRGANFSRINLIFVDVGFQLVVPIQSYTVLLFS